MGGGWGGGVLAFRTTFMQIQCRATSGAVCVSQGQRPQRPQSAVTKKRYRLHCISQVQSCRSALKPCNKEEHLNYTAYPIFSRVHMLSFAISLGIGTPESRAEGTAAVRTTAEGKTHLYSSFGNVSEIFAFLRRL